ncbi:hypothetical protein SUGI_0954120 [Cryptomeria japonica]|uniref:FBD-associated F-box protein At5g22730 n=1 Tax=Cryptomeria japonica TaxID=3369 RepID=UPI002414B29F|nr:FBD-associated F-box protein At5g22730 [Cryptomeria japonica]GLJ45326.1 hypothetical protein SUGI_0954120 [Cryptomeria japonica]
MATASATDRLSELSDDILLTAILSNISYRDVVRSSILSQRWRFLWRKIPVLKFCPEDFEKQKDDMRIQAIINNALLHLDARLCCLDLQIFLNSPKAIDLNNWIRLAAEKKVKSMHLEISCTPIMGFSMARLGDSLFSCENLINLQLRSIHLPKIPANSGVFPFLKTFYCFHIPNLDDSMFEGLIALCPQLRNLLIRGCGGLEKLKIHSSSLMYLNLGVSSPYSSLQMACPLLTEISLMDFWPYHIGLKLLQGISKAESIKKITLRNHNVRDPFHPGIPTITALNAFPGLEELTIHGLCFQEMISDRMQIAEVKLSNLKMVRAHIGTHKGGRALTFLGFLLKNSPLTSIIRVYLPQLCTGIMQNKMKDLEKQFSKSRSFTFTNSNGCEFCERCPEY